MIEESDSDSKIDVQLDDDSDVILGTEDDAKCIFCGGFFFEDICGEE